MQREYVDDEDWLSVHDDVERHVPTPLDEAFFQHDDVERHVPTPLHERGLACAAAYGPTEKELNFILSPPKPEPPLPTLSEQEVGICWLPLKDDVEDILETILDFFTEQKIDFSNPTPYEFVGYLFKETAYAFFHLLVYKREEDGLPGVRIRRLAGDAFLTCEMFKALRLQLVNYELVEMENDHLAHFDDQGDNLDDYFSDLEQLEEIEDEEEEAVEINLIDKPTSYLKLANDISMIEYWIHDISDSEYIDQKLYTLMMMAHNTEVYENIDLIMKHSGGKLFPSLMKVLEEDTKSLPMIRSCVRTLNNIIHGSENIDISWEMVKTMCECLLAWSQDNQNNKFSYDRPVSNSCGIQNDLASTLGHLNKYMNGEAPSEIQSVIEEVQMWLENDSDLCDPEARDKLGIFVENFTPIPVY